MLEIFDIVVTIGEFLVATVGVALVIVAFATALSGGWS